MKKSASIPAATDPSLAKARAHAEEERRRLIEGDEFARQLEASFQMAVATVLAKES